MKSIMRVLFCLACRSLTTQGVAPRHSLGDYEDTSNADAHVPDQSIDEHHSSIERHRTFASIAQEGRTTIGLLRSCPLRSCSTSTQSRSSTFHDARRRSIKNRQLVRHTRPFASFTSSLSSSARRIHSRVGRPLLLHCPSVCRVRRCV